MSPLRHDHTVLDSDNNNNDDNYDDGDDDDEHSDNNHNNKQKYGAYESRNLAPRSQGNLRFASCSPPWEALRSQ